MFKKLVNSPNYPILINIGLGLSFICLIISAENLVETNLSQFLLSLVVITQLMGLKRFLEDYQQKLNLINEQINGKVSLVDREKIGHQSKQIESNLKGLIAQIESKSKQNFYQLKQALTISQQQIKCIRKQLLKKQLEALSKQTQTPDRFNHNNDDLNDSIINSLEEKFNSLQQKIETQKSYGFFLINRKYQALIKQVEELLIPLYEKQTYLQELGQIREQQIAVKFRQIYLALDQLISEQQSNSPALNQLISSSSSTNTTKSSQLNPVSDQQNNKIQENRLNNYNYHSPTENVAEYISFVPSQVTLAHNLQQLNDWEAMRQKELEKKSQQIETLLQSFALQQQNLDQLLEDKTKTYSQNFEVIYYNMNQINQLMISLENKYQSFTKINRKFYSGLKTAITQLYNEEVKSIKNTLTNLVDNSNHLSKKQQELENLSYQVSGELKTEISQVKDEIFHELGRINDLLTAT